MLVEQSSTKLNGSLRTYGYLMIIDQLMTMYWFIIYLWQVCPSANNSNKVEQSCLQYINILYVIITLSLSQNIVSRLGVSRESTRDGRKEETRFRDV